MSERSDSFIHQDVCIKDRKILTMNGVINVEEFGENFLMLSTDCGIVYVEGREMRIESLTKESGCIVVLGTIDGVYYKNSPENKGWLNKFFK